MYKSKVRFSTLSAPYRGLNDRVHPATLKRSFTPDAKDVIYRDGWIEQRKGIEKVNSTAISGTTFVLGQGSFYRGGADPQRYHLIHSNEKIYKRTGGTVTSVVVDGFADEEQARFARGLNQILIANGEQAPVIYDGDTVIELLDAPRGRYPLFWNDYWWLANVRIQGNGPSLLYNSNLRDGTIWDADDVWNIETNDGEEITGIGVEGPYLSVFKQSSRTLLRGNIFDQSSSSFDAQKVAVLRGIGTLSQTGLVARGNVLYAPDREGIFALNGGEPIAEITRHIPDLWSRVNFDVGHTIHGVHWPEMRWILWALPIDGAGIPNRILVHDYQNDGLWLWDIESRSLVDYVDDAGIRHIYIGSKDGFIYDLYVGDTDDSSAIDSYIRWPQLGRESRGGHKLYEQLRLSLRSVGTHNLNVRVVADGRDGNFQSTTVANTESQTKQHQEVEAPISIAQVGRTLDVKLSNSSTGTWACREIAAGGRPWGMNR